MKVVCFGDSNTWGYDPRDFFCRPYDLIWPTLLQEMTGWRVINWGENGREIPTEKVSFPKDMDLLILMLGTNDLLQYRDPVEACKRMSLFLQDLKATVDRILLVAPPHMRYGTWVTDSELTGASVSMTELFRSLALQYGILFADAEEWNIPLAYDGVHFSEGGHRVFAEGLFRYLTEEEELCCKLE